MGDLITFFIKVIFMFAMIYNVLWGDLGRGLIMAIAVIPVFLFSIEMELEQLKKQKN